MVGTTEKIYITDIGIDWVEENGMFADFSIATYTLPNSILMKEEAEEEISRSDYQTEAEYNYAIAKWLYEEYPEYYQNPTQVYSNGSCSSYYYGDSLAVSNMIDDMCNVDVIGFVEGIWDGLGWATQGTLPGYLFTHNGSYRNFAQDATKFAKDVGEAVGDWWHDLWN